MKRAQFYLAFAVCIFGCGLLCASLILRPTGTIDTTVLTAFGEIEAVALALFGIQLKNNVSTTNTQAD